MPHFQHLHLVWSMEAQQDGLARPRGTHFTDSDYFAATGMSSVSLVHWDDAYRDWFAIRFAYHMISRPYAYISLRLYAGLSLLALISLRPFSATSASDSK